MKLSIITALASCATLVISQPLEKRVLIVETVYEQVVETVDMTTTVWKKPGEHSASATVTPQVNAAVFKQEPSSSPPAVSSAFKSRKHKHRSHRRSATLKPQSTETPEPGAYSYSFDAQTQAPSPTVTSESNPAYSYSFDAQVPSSTPTPQQSSQEQSAQEKSALKKAAQEKAAQEKAAQEKAAQEKAAQEEAAQEKAAREKASQEEAAQEKAAQEQAAQEEAAQEKAAQEKAAREQSARENPPQEQSAQENPPSFNGGGCGTVGGKCSGDLTYFEAGLGACGWTNDGESEDVFALAYEMMGKQSNGNPFCGRTATVTANGKSLVVKLVDKCMGCVGESIDLSYHAIDQIMDRSVGRMSDVKWTFND